jgi:hypothetical protein
VGEAVAGVVVVAVATDVVVPLAAAVTNLVIGY